MQSEEALVDFAEQIGKRLLDLTTADAPSRSLFGRELRFAVTVWKLELCSQVQSLTANEARVSAVALEEGSAWYGLIELIEAWINVHGEIPFDAHPLFDSRGARLAFASLGGAGMTRKRSGGVATHWLHHYAPYLASFDEEQGEWFVDAVIANSSLEHMDLLTTVASTLPLSLEALRSRITNRLLVLEAGGPTGEGVDPDLTTPVYGLPVSSEVREYDEQFEQFARSLLQSGFALRFRPEIAFEPGPVRPEAILLAARWLGLLEELFADSLESQGQLVADARSFVQAWTPEHVSRITELLSTSTFLSDLQSRDPRAWRGFTTLMAIWQELTEQTLGLSGW